MSALGHKRTFAVHQPMSALPPKADMCGAIADVGFGPKADIPMADLHCVIRAAEGLVMLHRRSVFGASQS